jgi:haloalkane dehalogenase
MTDNRIGAEDALPRQRIEVLDGEMAYVDTGDGIPVVFLHGNPTSSYLWRNIIPHVAPVARCLAPDLIGMGESSRIPGSMYWFVDHRRYLDAWFSALGLERDVVLVGHDWGSALAFHWAHRHPERVGGLVYFEALVRPFPAHGPPNAPGEKVPTQQRFREMRSPAGERMILEENYFVEDRLPSRILRDLSEEEMAVYRRPYLEAGESRRPTLTWPREVPIGGEPPDVHEIMDAYAGWLAETPVPKLLVVGDPGGLIHGELLDFCRTFSNQREVTVPGIHFLQEDAPHEIGAAIRAFVENL